jgi:DNA-binding transcriptional regulator LsrR (DeoR family)
MTVSRLLKSARERGIVQITIARRIPRIAEYERKLIERFGLAYAIVVDATEESHLELVPKAAAQHLQILLEPDIVIGMGVGPTISRVVAELHNQSVRGAIVVQLSGGYHETGEGYSHDIVRDMSDVLGARGIYFHAPAIFSDVAGKKAVLNNVMDASLYSYWEKCSLALVTANPIRTEAALMEAGFLKKHELQELRALGAVGSILANFYDINGRFVEHDIHERVASIPLAMLRNVRNVVAVIRYRDREKSLLGALRTGIVNTVVTDVISARKLLLD